MFLFFCLGIGTMEVGGGRWRDVNEAEMAGGVFGSEANGICSAGIIIAGYTPKHGGSVYSVPLGGSLHKQSYAIGGSGSTYIYGYCDSYWKEGMNEEEGIAFVKGALREAIKWDGSSGGVIRLVVLTNKGAIRHLYLPDQDYKGPGTG